MNKTITLELDGQFAAISDDAVENVTREMNDAISGESHIYSDSQIKTALWKFLSNEIDELLENIEDRFMDKYSKLHDWQQGRLLGDPELNVKEEANLARADYLYDLRQEG